MAEMTLAEQLQDRLRRAYEYAANGDVDLAVAYARFALEDWEHHEGATPQDKEGR